jgi:hypothetical protein
LFLCLWSGNNPIGIPTFSCISTRIREKLMRAPVKKYDVWHILLFVWGVYFYQKYLWLISIRLPIISACAHTCSIEFHSLHLKWKSLPTLSLSVSACRHRHTLLDVSTCCNNYTMVIKRKMDEKATLRHLQHARLAIYKTLHSTHRLIGFTCFCRKIKRIIEMILK